MKTIAMIDDDIYIGNILRERKITVTDDGKITAEYERDRLSISIYL